MFVAIHEYTAQVGPYDWERVRNTRILSGTETVSEVMGWAKGHNVVSEIRLEIMAADNARVAEKETT